MSSSRERKAALKKLKNLIFLPKTEVKEYREKMDSTFGNVFLPNRVENSEREYGSVKCDVLAPEIYSSRRVILYIHGGCFVGGSRKSVRPFAAALAAAVSARAVVPEFRLAPTHPYPASLDDVQAVFRSLYTEELVANSLDLGLGSDTDKGQPEVIVMADGSGASIAMGLVLSLRERFRASIRKVVLFSPWLDISTDSKIISTKKSADELLTGECIRRSAELYTYQDNRSIPFVSPVKASVHQFEGFPPVFIQMGEKEILVDDAKKLQSLIQEAGGECELDIWPDMMNMFQLADDELNESHLAIEKIGKLFTSRKVSEDDTELNVQLKLETKYDR